MDRFGPGWAGYRRVDSILRPKSLSWIHAMTMEGLSTYETSQASSEWTKTAIVGAILGRFLGLRESYFGANIGMNGHCEEMVLSSRALNYLIGA